MNVRLHANATATPKTRRYIQEANKPVAALARELGVRSGDVVCSYGWPARACGPSVVPRRARLNRPSAPLRGSAPRPRRSGPGPPLGGSSRTG